MARPVRILHATPVHPGPGQRSRIEVAVDTGLKSGSLSFATLNPAEACELAEELLHAANIVRRSNTQRNVVVQEAP